MVLVFSPIQCPLTRRDIQTISSDLVSLQEHNRTILFEEEKNYKMTTPKAMVFQSCKYARLGVCKGLDLLPLN